METETSLKQKTILIPYLSDHVYAVGAAMSAHGIPNRVLPRSSDASLDLGLDLI